jgi:hypothetical protein
MLEAMQKATRHFPARLLTPGEHALVAEWLAVAGDVSSAYVSDRRGDEPAYYRRIVVIMNPDDGPSHLVSGAAGREIWIVFSLGRRTRIQHFRTLRAALNSIRPVLVEVRQTTR